MPSPRSDLALELHLAKLLSSTETESVKPAIAHALSHVRSGAGGKRKGGRRLTELLGAARLSAAQAEEWEVVRSLHDAIQYTEGHLLRPDYEEKYRLHYLFRGPRDSLGLEAAARTLAATNEFWCLEAEKYLSDHPESHPGEVLAHLRKLGADTRFMQAPVEDPARYHIPRGVAELALWIERVLTNRVEVTDPAESARRIVSSPKALAVLAADEDGRTVLRAAELRRRAMDLRELRRMSEDDTTTEHALQRALNGMHWIFGGRVMTQAHQRRLVAGDEVDIPLLRGDGSLQIVELKRAAGVRLVKEHRGSWVPRREVHDAVGQAINYLVGLDESRERVQAEFGIDTRRASALVLIGHPMSQPGVSEQEINEVLRIHTSHLHRIEVLTYKELIDSAERALAMGEAA
ncbi:Shedu anti-phage system protein SduA domain-containing protein [Streptomyces buecherae]|uniref:Shedu anti-phage system protein SduA domain-containing protein n=1 Tax=Streptomyces buecherae TaxID=2763006 RepID=UPI001C269E7A|nr:Shedu anti-phage system protein SduA domain-containing protein [Streptomyces buecherae]